MMKRLNLMISLMARELMQNARYGVLVRQAKQSNKLISYCLEL